MIIVQFVGNFHRLKGLKRSHYWTLETKAVIIIVRQTLSCRRGTGLRAKRQKVIFQFIRVVYQSWIDRREPLSFSRVQ